jgi:hypothetical protein
MSANASEDHPIGFRCSGWMRCRGMQHLKILGCAAQRKRLKIKDKTHQRNCRQLLTFRIMDLGSKCGGILVSRDAESIVQYKF